MSGIRVYPNLLTPNHSLYVCCAIRFLTHCDPDLSPPITIPSIFVAFFNFYDSAFSWNR